MGHSYVLSSWIIQLLNRPLCLSPIQLGELLSNPIQWEDTVQHPDTCLQWCNCNAGLHQQLSWCRLRTSYRRQWWSVKCVLAINHIFIDINLLSIAQSEEHAHLHTFSTFTLELFLIMKVVIIQRTEYTLFCVLFLNSFFADTPIFKYICAHQFQYITFMA